MARPGVAVYCNMSEVKSGQPPTAELRLNAAPSGPGAGGGPLGPGGPGLTTPENNKTNFLSTFKQLLTDKKFEIPIEANFIIRLNLNQSLIRSLRQINDTGVNFQIEPVAYSVINSQVQTDNILSRYNNLGFVYANKITLPGEQLNNARIGLDTDTAGILQPLPVLKNRASVKTLSLDILETNLSYLEAYVRPWIIITSLYGMFIRNRDNPQNVRMDTLEVIQFDRQRNIRKQLNFFNVVPVSMSENSIAYGLNGGKKVINTNWLFESYSVISN